MTPWPRIALRTTGVLAVLGAAALPCGSASAYDPGKVSPDPTAARPTPASAASARPAPEGAPGHPASASARPSSTASTAHRPAPASASARPAAAPSAASSPHPAEPSLAGSRPGEGRQRPGRSTEPDARVEGDDTAPPEDEGARGRHQGGRDHGAWDDGAREEGADPTGAPTETAAPRTPEEATPAASVPPGDPEARSAARSGSAAEPVLRILPLGSGLVLIGLGLGLAFVGLRVRRG